MPEDGKSKRSKRCGCIRGEPCSSSSGSPCKAVTGYVWKDRDVTTQREFLYGTKQSSQGHNEAMHIVGLEGWSIAYVRGVRQATCWVSGNCLHRRTFPVADITVLAVCRGDRLESCLGDDLDSEWKEQHLVRPVRYNLQEWYRSWTLETGNGHSA